jgi:uncharacterized protein (TIGR02452 family)
MKAAEDGFYFLEDREVKLPFDFPQIKETKLYMPGQLAQLPALRPEGGAGARITLRNQDTLEAAWELHRHRKETERNVLVLNFANPHRPGGGIRSRPGTQEEHLCVKTTLLCSLETEEAWPFYQTNLDCATQAQTDAILYSANTMVIRNPDLSLREDPFPIAVMTVSAPVASRMEPEELTGLEKILENRIDAMVRTAIAEGYTRLVLGAWGCGNFGNDPDLVAKLFHRILADGSGFAEITMAVFDNTEEQVRYRSFAGYFPEG